MNERKFDTPYTFGRGVDIGNPENLDTLDKVPQAANFGFENVSSYRGIFEKEKKERKKQIGENGKNTLLNNSLT